MVAYRYGTNRPIDKEASALLARVFVNRNKEIRSFKSVPTRIELYRPNGVRDQKSLNCLGRHVHWRRLVKNVGWANQNIEGGKGGKK